MSRLRILLLVFLAVTVTLLVYTGGGVTATGPSKVPVIIAFHQQPGPAQEALVRQAGGAIKYTYDLVPAIAATVPEPAIAGLQANPNVLRVEPDIEVHAIDHPTLDVELDSAWGVAHIGAGTVHGGGNKGTGVKVAILDTGIDTNHPDLSYDPSCSASFVSGETIEDGNGHGTHTAGTVAALDNDTGVVGVAPEATLCIYKVLSNSGGGFYSDIIAALDRAVSDGVQVTNNSYGSSGDPGAIVKAAFDTAYAAGVLHAAAAGNSGNSPGRGDNCIYPARWDSLIATAATKADDNRAKFSSTCPELELAAPGYRINSTVPGGGYSEKSGTSMASPHVAGTAALVFAANPGWSNDDVRTQLQNTADDLGSTGRDTKYGYGLVNADEAAWPSAPDTAAPVISNVADTDINDTSATITWDTDESADSLVDYGLDSTYGSFVSDGSLVTSHSITLTGLNSSTEYHYKVTSEDAALNSASSADFTFTTAAADTIEPVITNVMASNITDTSADITWDTDESADSLVYYGVETTYGSSVSDGSMVTIHSITLTGLGLSTEYHYKVTSEDAASNSASSADLIFTTAAAPTEATAVSVASIIYDTEGGRNGDKHLLITVALLDDFDDPVADASVSIDLYLAGVFYASGAGTTGTDGTVTFRAKNAPSGCYDVEVTDVTAAGWDDSYPINSFAKGAGAAC